MYFNIKKNINLPTCTCTRIFNKVKVSHVRYIHVLVVVYIPVQCVYVYTRVRYTAGNFSYPGTCNLNLRCIVPVPVLQVHVYTYM